MSIPATMIRMQLCRSHVQNTTRVLSAYSDSESTLADTTPSIVYCQWSAFFLLSTCLTSRAWNTLVNPIFYLQPPVVKLIELRGRLTGILPLLIQVLDNVSGARGVSQPTNDVHAFFPPSSCVVLLVSIFLVVLGLENPAEKW